MIHLNKIYKSYGDTKVIEDLNLKVEEHEFAVLVGPSGCGKSTLLRMIAGLESITSGELHLGDRCVTDVSPRDRDIAMVFQNYALYPHMNVADNISLSLKLKKVPKETIKEEVQKVAQTLGIEHLLKRKPRALSGGQRQRVAMGRAIIRNPRAFLFDEPLSNLDASLRLRMRTEIKQLHSRLNITTVYVTHDQVEAMTLADRIVVMKGGKIQQQGSPMEIFNRPANRFVGKFIGSPPMNFFNCDHPSLQWQQRDKIAQLTRNESSPELGIRPDHLHLKTQVPDAALSLACEVTVVEPLGTEMLVDLQSASGALRWKTPWDPQLKTGDIVQLAAKNKDLHFFEGHHGKRISGV